VPVGDVGDHGLIGRGKRVARQRQADGLIFRDDRAQLRGNTAVTRQAETGDATIPTSSDSRVSLGTSEEM